MKPRDWFEWAQFFADEQERLCEKYDERLLLKTPGTAAEKFYESDCATQPNLEPAVRHFAEHRQWPELDPLSGAMLLARLSAAYWLARTLHFAAANSILPESAPALSLDFFLVRGWFAVGAPQTGARLADLLPADDSTSAEQSHPHANN